MNDRYSELLTEINKMLSERDRGYNEAQKMNDAFWENLGTHKLRMEEQIKMTDNQAIGQKLNVDSTYEAAWELVNKYKDASKIR